MLISTKSNTLSVLLYCILTIILLSCGTETSSSKNDIHGTVHPDGNGLAMVFASPGDLANTLIGGYMLQAEATVNGETYPLDVHPDTNEISGTIPDISAGTHSIQVTYFISTTEKIILCTFSKDVTVTAGQQSDVIIGDSDLNRNYHNDTDGYTNLDEIKENTDPLNSDDYPTTPPDPPANVSAIAGVNQVTLSWDSVTSTLLYNIYMGTSSGVSKNNYDLSYTCDEASCYIPDLTGGELYYFVVTSVNVNGESIESAEVNAKPFKFEPDCMDGDGDNYGEGLDCLGTDCNDSDSSINPGSTEICDGKDNDCDGNADETGNALCDNGEYCDGKETCTGTGGCKDGSPPCSDGETCSENTDTCEDICTDKDNDGYSVEGGSCGSVDCDDNNADTYPDAQELCDGKDNNCNGIFHDNETDKDGDGYFPCEGDCDDSNADTYPDAPELCDKLDNDCDGTIDNGECPGNSCGEAFIWDCNNNCTFEMWLGDGTCDNDPTEADFTCINNDEGDCTPDPGDSCDVDKIYDCLFNCEPAEWLGDGFICDNDNSNIDPDVADFTCINNDNGDCL